MMPGGLTEAKPATPEIQEIADEVKHSLKKKQMRLRKNLKV